MSRSLDGNTRPLPDYVRVQRGWYRRNLFQARLGSYALEILVLFCGAAIAVSSALSLPPWVTSVLGAAVAVLTGLRTLFGWKENRRARTKALIDIDAEVARYGRGTAPYDTGDTKSDGDLLQEKIIEVVKTEADAWAKRDAARTGHSSTE